MDTRNKRNPAGQVRGSSGLHSGREYASEYNPKAAPAAFWQGYNGPASMSPPIHRRQPKPVDTFWNPKRAGGAA